MHSGRLVFAQVMDFIPRYVFYQCVLRYSGSYKVQHFSGRNQFICMAFGQLTYRNGLRDIITCLRANKTKLYHIGIKGNVSLNNLSNANMNRDWRIYADFAQVLIATAKDLYCDDQFSEEISETVYALDSSTISLSLSLFPWAEFRKCKSGTKLHTIMELPSSIPTVIDITEAKPYDVNFLDRLIIEQGTIYVMDLGYMDYERLFRITKSNAFFVTRVKKNAKLKRRYSRKKDSSVGILSDQVVVAKSVTSLNKYPAALRRIRYRDSEDGRIIIFFTNNFELSALSITQL